jgi:hypothetical protein
MDIIDHGDWVVYRPERHWLLQQNNKVLFCRRASDGLDWYEYRIGAGILTSSTVKMTLMKQGGEWTVMTTERDGTVIWPEACKLIEFAFDGEHETLRRKIFNLVTHEFTDPEAVKIERPLLRALAEELGVDEHQLATNLRSQHG